MKIIVDKGDIHVSFEREPMPPERFAAVCKLVAVAIGGVVLLAAIRMVGTWAIGGALAALAAVGFYKGLKAMST